MNEYRNGTPRAKPFAMPAVDSLLKLMLAQGADALLITSAEVPRLLRGGAKVPLSMPELDPGLVSTFVTEVVGSIDESPLSSGDRIETVYESLEGTRFKANVEPRGTGFHLRFNTLDSTPHSSRQGRLSRRSGAAAEVDRPTETTDEPTETANEPTETAGTVKTNQPEVVTPPLDTITTSSMVSDQTPGDPLLLMLITDAVAQGTSDILLSTEERPRARFGGQLRPIGGDLLEADQIYSLFDSTLDERLERVFQEKGNVDLALLCGGVRMRANLFRHENGLAASLRPIRSDIPTLSALNLPADLIGLTRFPHGLVLITGATGSGKSTTLAALVEHINQRQARHIITLEDPIEYLFGSAQSLVHQREVGRHVKSFADGLRAALRENPDVILLGEMRDLPTIAAAITAAETGHLVLSTLHTGSAAAAIDRIIDVFPGEQQAQVRMQLAGALRGVVAQTLLPAHTPPARVPALEKLMVTSAVAAQIRDQRSHQIQSSIQSGRDEGMISLERSLASLVKNGLVAFDKAYEAANDKASLRQLVGR